MPNELLSVFPTLHHGCFQVVVHTTIEPLPLESPACPPGQGKASLPLGGIHLLAHYCRSCRGTGAVQGSLAIWSASEFARILSAFGGTCALGVQETQSGRYTMLTRSGGRASRRWEVPRETWRHDLPPTPQFGGVGLQWCFRSGSGPRDAVVARPSPFRRRGSWLSKPTVVQHGNVTLLAQPKTHARGEHV